MTLPTPIHLLPTAQELCALLDYDPDTGVLTWRVARGSNAPAGGVAGCDRGDGYRRIEIDGRRIYAHRIAWAISIGEWPVSQIDHVNGIRDDNRLANLREATHAENHQNRRRSQRNSKSGFLGVHFRKNVGKWQAGINIGRERKYLGLFATAELAHAAYLAAKADLHPFQTIANTNEKD